MPTLQIPWALLPHIFHRYLFGVWKNKNASSERISTHFLLLVYTSTIAILLVILLSWISSCTALPQSSLYRPLLANDEIFLAPGHSLQSQGSGARTRTVWRRLSGATMHNVWKCSKSVSSFGCTLIIAGNALARVQRVHKPAGLWDITFCTQWFWGF